MLKIWKFFLIRGARLEGGGEVGDEVGDGVEDEIDGGVGKM
jgi:hypothetical protein